MKRLSAAKKYVDMLSLVKVCFDYRMGSHLTENNLENNKTGALFYYLLIVAPLSLGVV